MSQHVQEDHKLPGWLTHEPVCEDSTLRGEGRSKGHKLWKMISRLVHKEIFTGIHTALDAQYADHRNKPEQMGEITIILGAGQGQLLSLRPMKWVFFCPLTGQHSHITKYSFFYNPLVQANQLSGRPEDSDEAQAGCATKNNSVNRADH